MKLLILLFPCFVSAQMTTYSNQYGQPIGSSVTVGNMTVYSNQYGQPVASSTQPPSPVQPYTPPAPPSPAPVYTPIQPTYPATSIFTK
jgi:hypothetical protein